MDQIIVDSSICAKWFFSDEYSENAFKIREDFRSRVIRISIPLLFYYEINNLLKTGAKAFRIDPKEAKGLFKSFLDLSFTAYSSKELHEEALDIAIKYDISSYDASYIALAVDLKKPFFTADKKLLLKVKSKFAFDLEKYPINL